MRTLLLFVLSVLCTASCLAQRGATIENKAAVQKGQIRAVVIGVSEYPQMDTKKQLDYAHKDAALFHNYLLQAFAPTDIILLTNKEATANNAQLYIDEYIKKSENGDELIIFFAGHGDVSKDTTKNTDDAYLLCTNAATDADYSATDAISLGDLQNRIAEAAKKGITIMLITDACRSGKIPTSEAAASATVNILIQKWDKVIKIASCQENELSYENIKWGGGHGVFTYYLVKGLTGEADRSIPQKPKDSLITLNELELYIKAKVPDETETSQNPMKVGGDAKRVFAGALPSYKINPENNLPLLAMVSKKRAASADDTVFHNKQLDSIYISFRSHLQRRQTDSAYHTYLAFRNEDKQQASLLKNELILSCASSAQDVIEKYLQGGNNMPSSPDFQKAGENMKLAIELYDRKNAFSKKWRSKHHFLQAHTFIRAERREKYKEATKLLQKSIKLNKKAAYAYASMGRLYQDLEQNETAVRYLLKAIELSPRWTYPKSDLGNAYFSMGRWEESIGQFHRALQLDSTLARGYNNLSLIYLDQGKLSQSEHLFLKADSILPGEPIYLSNLGVVYSQQGRLKEAKEKFEAALAADSNSFIAHQKLGNYYVNNSTDADRADKALFHLTKANQLEPYFTETYVSLGDYYNEYYSAKESNALAEHFYKKAIELDMHNREAWYDLAVLQQYRQKDTLAADRTIGQMMQHNKNNAEAYYYRALHYININNNEQAEDDLRKAISMNVYEKYAYLQLASLLEKRGRYEEAEKKYLQALMLFQDSPEMTHKLGSYYLRRNEPAKAIEWFNTTLAIDSSYSYAWSSLAYTLLRYTENAEQAAGSFMNAYKLNPYKHTPKEFATLMQIKADSIGINGAIEYVVRLYATSLKMDSANASRVHYAIAQLYYLKDSAKIASDYLHRIGDNISLNLKDNIRSLQWKIALATGALEKAKQLIEEEINDTPFPSYTGMALYEKLLGNIAKAKELLQKEQLENPASLTAIYIERHYSPAHQKLIQELLK